jgi:hypothetical protein
LIDVILKAPLHRNRVRTEFGRRLKNLAGLAGGQLRSRWLVPSRIE